MPWTLPCPGASWIDLKPPRRNETTHVMILKPPGNQLVILWLHLAYPALTYFIGRNKIELYSPDQTEWIFAQQFILYIILITILMFIFLLCLSQNLMLSFSNYIYTSNLVYEYFFKKTLFSIFLSKYCSEIWSSPKEL